MSGEPPPLLKPVAQRKGNVGQTDNRSKKVAFVLGMQALIAAFVVAGVGSEYELTSSLYHSYFFDITLPFAFYFLLTLNEHQHPFLRPWWVKAAGVFALCATSEMLQFIGIYALARVFDPLDFIMYATGVLLAASFERAVLARYLPFWT